MVKATVLYLVSESLSEMEQFASKFMCLGLPISLHFCQLTRISLPILLKITGNHMTGKGMIKTYFVF